MACPPNPSLKLYNLILLEPKLSQNPRSPTRSNQCLLHSRRATNKDLRITILHNTPQQLLRNITLLEPITLSLRMTDNISIFEPIRIPGLESLQLLSEQQILFSIHAEHEIDLRLVVGIVQDPLRELVDWRDTRAAGNEVDLAGLVGCPGVSFQCRCEGECIAWDEGVDVRACFPIWVFLHHEFDVAFLVCWLLVCDLGVGVCWVLTQVADGCVWSWYGEPSPFRAGQCQE